MATTFGRYQLVKKLASGGMGEVFLARGAAAGGPEKLLVLKRILPHLAENKEFLNLFLDEARIAARLNHPNVVQILELGDVDGAWYLLMEYVAGKDLRQLAQTARARRQRLPLGLACRIAAEAAAGLDYAHRAMDAQGRPMKIVHRDVSPQNVLVSFDGAVKLIDFGVAKAASRLPQTDEGVLRGKYPYMSPEQVAVDEFDHRSDQFSLGVVFWELLTGQRLFKGRDDAQTLQRVAACVVPAPSRKDEALPPRLVEIVSCALQKDPRQRFADLAAFRLELLDLVTAQQWPASSADLANFVGALFPDDADDQRQQRKQSARARPSRPVAAGTPPVPEAVPPLAEGVELFLERARLARPGWTASEPERRSVEELIRRLDGIPLAIELAAARMATLGPAEVEKQLPRPDAASRQATLRAVIGWSWDLLQGHEQLALAQLSVLRGDFTLEAAEAVICLSSFPQAPWALDVVQGLRNQSLLRASEAVGSPGELRFGFFECIREYALEKLKALGPDDERQARARHAAWSLSSAAPHPAVTSRSTSSSVTTGVRQLKLRQR